MLQTLVLGSGAGGGVPQWNCGCKNCKSPTTKVRTQSSIIVTKNNWKSSVLINSSPDFATQIRQNKILQPSELRNSSINDIILSDSHIDHITGLLSMRESDKLNVYCSHQVYEDLSIHFNIFDTLQNYTQVNVNTIVPNETFSVNDILFIGIPIKGKAPPYSPRRNSYTLGDTLAISIENELLYSPSVETITPELIDSLNKHNTILIDGTFHNHDDMITQGLGNKHSYDMGHINMTDHKIFLENLTSENKYFIHINNSNPVLNDENLLPNNWKLSHDGMILFS